MAAKRLKKVVSLLILRILLIYEILQFECQTKQVQENFPTDMYVGKAY